MSPKIDSEPILSERLFRQWLMGYISSFYEHPEEYAKTIQGHATDIIDFMKENNLLNIKPE